eukprot:922921-Amphidinium_carterae.3
MMLASVSTTLFTWDKSEGAIMMTSPALETPLKAEASSGLRRSEDSDSLTLSWYVDGSTRWFALA